MTDYGTKLRKLRDLIEDIGEEFYSDTATSCDYHTYIADRLLYNGVILPPVKVGDKVYYICEEAEEFGGDYISELAVTEVSNVRFWVQNENDNHFRYTDIGKTVFLTREEAEAKLRAEGKQ